MTSNTPGHVNNLDQTQIEALKNCWITLIDAISKEVSLPVDQIIGSTVGDELFRSIGYDNPDVLVLRWLRARKFDVNTAVEQLIETLKWRLEWGVNKLLEKGENELLLEELILGKSYFMGSDKEGRPVNYIHVKEHLKDQYPIEATEKLGILSVETGRKLLENCHETGSVVVDMNGFGMHNMDYQLVRFFIHLLESYYPESLGIVLIIHAPFFFHGCWTIIRRWLDPVVESKIHFLKHNEELTKFIDRSNLPKRLDGTHIDFKYIPPTDQHRTMLTTIHADKQGRKLAKAAHRKAARHYLDLTLKWAHEENNHKFIEERKEGATQLRDAFEQFVPYIHTPTYYHRIGVINEPIFDIVYGKICRNNQLNIVEF